MGIRKILPNEVSDAEWRGRARDSVNAVINLAEGLALYSLGGGATASRPVTSQVGSSFFDTTLGLPIWWNGTAWVNAIGVAV